MGRPALRVHNHTRRIVGIQSAIVKALYPGMICQFRYKKVRTTDPKPLVLILWNDYQGYKLHGINLNYLTDFQVRKIITDLSSGGPQPQDDNPLAVEDQEEGSYDDKLPQKNLLKKPFTKVQLPTEKMEDGTGRVLSRTEAETKIKRIYGSLLKKYVDRLFVYRTYSYELVKNIKVIDYDIGGLTK